MKPEKEKVGKRSPLLERHFRESGITYLGLLQKCGVHQSQLHYALRGKSGARVAERIASCLAEKLGLALEEKLGLKAEMLGKPRVLRASLLR